ncbi:cytochrome ubiquinol oxidase subunit I [Paraphotobacterium marinum]|uniref:Cytochrome ubiquinol oxidase subunit I n=1 Tax=Paraphotobacterium marinum TaxID=1755811 RepID=A0A220VGD5_9GAMM|nr:cytochrome ubiquinol oxidase subunit I [Paraphotobacterium marinum]ASK79478.1 cytochrome ubiquinol oxidase subunit I [Paraphotobacterium marinum]
MDMELLSRIQFAFTISFHILFPAFSIGLAGFLTITEGMYLLTKKELYLIITKFWVKVFALTFGMGVVSGIVIEFQFGTNWAGFSETVGPVLGSLFVYEVLTAFFIEAGALGIMLFGWKRVNKYVHYGSTVIIFLGVLLSAFWILSANSWLQTPTGVEFVNNSFVVNSWKEVILNPSVWDRYIHMVLAAFMSTLMIIIGTSAWYYLKNRHRLYAKTCIHFAIPALFFISLLQVYMGDRVGLVIHENQPIKTAAMEGNWETQNGAPLILFALPSQEDEKNYFEVKIPKLASFINTHEWDGELIGLKSVAKDERPYVPIVFWTFRIMVGIGLLAVFVYGVGLYKMIRGQLESSKWLLRGMITIAPLGFVAIIAGWFTAEVGRQPWMVNGFFKTADAVSELSYSQVLISLLLIILIYFIVFGIFYFRYLFRILDHGPEEIGHERMPFGYFEPGTDEKEHSTLSQLEEGKSHGA